MKKVTLLLLAILVLSSCTKEEINSIIPTTPTTPSGEETPDTTSHTEPPVTVDTVKLVGQSYTMKNYVTATESSISLRFNMPVRCNSISVGGQAYTPSKSNGDSVLTVQVPMKFGYTYDGSLQVSNAKTGKTWPFSFTVKTFEDQYEYEGTLVKVLCDDKQETIWMTTVDVDKKGKQMSNPDVNPYLLRRISMSDPSKATATKEFNQSPNVMALNPYNNKLYVGTLVKDNYEAKVYDFKIHILNPKTLEEEGSFVVSEKKKKVGSGDNEYWQPDATPRSMAFTDDGYGIIVMQRYGSSGTELCFVDSKDNHKLKYDRECWPNRYMGVTANYDKKSLIIYCEAGKGPDFYTSSRSKQTPKLYDVDSRYHSTDYYAGGNVHSRIFHRSKPVYYAQSVYSLCRIDYSTGTYSPVMIDDARGSFMEVDYLHDDCVIFVDAVAKIMKYKDLSKDEIPFVTDWFNRANGDGYYPMIHETSRDILLTFWGANTTTYLITYDMNRLRK